LEKPRTNTGSQKIATGALLIMKKLNTRNIRSFKKTDEKRFIHMLTCYDFQTAKLLNETKLDLILVGDSLGNVVLGYDTTVSVSLEEMIIFTSAVKRGARNKFVIGDLPFGTYNTVDEGLKNATKLFQESRCEALKLEGAFPHQLELIERLTHIGIPVMGHIGLTPQSVHQQGGYYTHGKDENSVKMLMENAKKLESAGCFSIVLECIEKDLSAAITKELMIPTIGIGAGSQVDGQVLVINDLLKLGSDYPPSFCQPVADFYSLKKEAINNYLSKNHA
jgi:3-methyl-2-oxobutanoate hydroxymethyltransferase